VVAEELDHPGEHAGGGVARGEHDADDVVRDLGIGERLAVVEKGGQEVAAPALPLAPRRDDVGHDGAEALARLHRLVEQGARQVHRHRVVPLLQRQVALLQLLNVAHLLLAEDGEQCHIQRVLQPRRRHRLALAPKLEQNRTEQRKRGGERRKVQYSPSSSPGRC
jgi:hypothetical protein